MRTRTRGLLGALAAAALAASVLPLAASSTLEAATSPAARAAPTGGATAGGAPPARDDASGVRNNAPDELPNPFADKQREMRKKAVEKLVRGDAKVQQRDDSKVVRMQDGSYVEMVQEDTDQIFTILTEFGTKTHPDTGGSAGPRRNEIPKPNRRQDNSTYWVDDFNRQHYLDMFFGDDGATMADFYRKQSQGRYTVDGDVSDWVQLEYNEARYGSNDVAEEDGYWNYIKDTAQAWYDAQRKQGKSPEQIKQYLSRFDKWDRYDHDGDGDFNEPDGYIDHFQAIHAGEGEEAGGGAQGDDAIWSHRWFAFPDVAGDSGPETKPMGGVPIGNSGMWIGDYTTEPENGGVGVFAHEYGHDLGLPDLYDTAGGDNGTAYWSLMSSGSWLGHGKDAIGTTPGYMGAWEKLQLGWLDYAVASPNQTSTHTLGRAARQGPDPQALVVPLPKKKVQTEYNTPHSGSNEWWGGSADNLNTTLQRTIDLTDFNDAKLSTKAWYEIEEDYDFLLAQVSTDGGETWETVGDPVTGSSENNWVDLNYDLSKYAGEKLLFQFRYRTDGGVHLAGPMLDDLTVHADGEEIFSDDVEDGVNGWNATGWKRIDGTVTEHKGKYYLAENRRYVDYDATLRTGPYNFNREVSKPNWVQHFPYQDGLLVWQWDETQEDNNTSEHPGRGLILPIDARAQPLTWDNGKVLGNRFQPFDATFGQQSTDALSLDREVEHDDGVRVLHAEQAARPAKPVFDDSAPKRYWNRRNPQGSVRVAGHGVRIGVQKESADGARTTVQVGPSPEKHVQPKRGGR